MEIDIFADAEETKKGFADENSLGEISKIANEIIAVEKELEEANKKVSELKSKVGYLKEVSLPEAMDNIGLSEVKLATGEKVTIKPFVKASIPKDKSHKAFQWLRDHGYDSIIKRNVSVAFGRGEDEIANKAKELLISQGFEVLDKENVHHSTLNSFVKELIEDGKSLPEDAFTVYMGRTSVIK